MGLNPDAILYVPPLLVHNFANNIYLLAYANGQTRILELGDHDNYGHLNHVSTKFKDHIFSLEKTIQNGINYQYEYAHEMYQEYVYLK